MANIAQGEAEFQSSSFGLDCFDVLCGHFESLIVRIVTRLSLIFIKTVNGCHVSRKPIYIFLHAYNIMLSGDVAFVCALQVSSSFLCTYIKEKLELIIN